MLLVRTKLGVSKIHGMGLFADQPIPKGTVTWEYDPIFDVAFTKKQIDALPKIAREKMYHYTYFDKVMDKYVLCGDDQRFINHTAGTPNIESTVRKDVAIRDINKDEELLCEYHKFDDSYFNRLNIKKEDLL